MKEIEELKRILLNDDVINFVKENEATIFRVIPMLEYEKGFDQKSEWHIYDVWNHTLKAISFSPLDFEIRLILLLHDIGKPFSYQDDDKVRHFHGHALKSKELAKPILERLGYKNDKLEELLFLIGEHATSIHADDVNCENALLYKKLLMVQLCDARAYEPSHAKKIIRKLKKINEEVQNKKLYKK